MDNQLLEFNLKNIQLKYKMEVNSLQDLIELIEKYKNRKKRTRSAKNEVLIPYNADLEQLLGCVKPLKKLNDLVGMDELKKNIIDQILFYAQELNTNEMMHTCLTGPPGVGKTTLGKILAELYCSLGFLETDKFNVVTSSDLIAGYVGQTAIKTKKVLKDALGGVLFIDEAYSLGTSDSESLGFSKECIDTINAFLSENTSNFILIIAGYQNDLDRSFFSLNPGLRRRFPWIYDISKYSITNLSDIFIHQVNENDWSLDDILIADNYKVLKSLFNDYSNVFTNNGGDTLTLFDKAKICHSRRVFGKDKSVKMILNFTDITLAADLLKNHKNKIIKIKEPPYGMYL